MKKRAAWVSTMTLYKKGPAIGGARFAQAYLPNRQRPKNSHNRIITGIGTPSNHSKIPRPMISSMHSSCDSRTQKARLGSGESNGNEDLESGFPASEFQKASYQWPVFGIEAQGSAGGFASPFCKSSIECKSGERTKAIWPSRGGRLMVMPIFFRRSQVA